MYESLAAGYAFLVLLVAALAFAFVRVFVRSYNADTEFRLNEFRATLAAGTAPGSAAAGGGAIGVGRSPSLELPRVVVESSSRELVPGLPNAGENDGSRLPDAAALVVLSAVEALGTSQEGRSLEPFATPTAAEQLACVVKAVRAYARATAPETADGALQVEVLAARAMPRSQGEARVVICTPPTSSSGHREAVVRADQIWRLGKQPPTSCGACGAPVVDNTSCCDYCDADIGEGVWRIVEVEPSRDSKSPLSDEWTTLDNYLRSVDASASASPLVGALVAELPNERLV